MRYFIGYLADRNFQNYYRVVTNDLSTRFEIVDLSFRVPAHLTIKYPFESSNPSHILHLLTEITKTIHRATFLVDMFGRFNDNDKTIFLSTQQSEELRLLIEHCIVELGDLHEEKVFDPKKYVPHFSVARHLDAETNTEIWKYVSTLPKPNLSQKLDNLTLFKYEDAKWKIEETFTFLP